MNRPLDDVKGGRAKAKAKTTAAAKRGPSLRSGWRGLKT